MTSSTAFVIPFSPSVSAFLSACITPPSTIVISSQCAKIAIPCSFAIFIALRYKDAFITDFPSSLIAWHPAFAIPTISASSSPACPTVIAPSCITCTLDSFFALSCTCLTFSSVSITGFVFGIAQIVVTPPLAAASPPVLSVSLYSSPGSRKCTCKSINPGITKQPFASITLSAASAICSATFTIFFSSTRISYIPSVLLSGSSTCPF